MADRRPWPRRWWSPPSLSAAVAAGLLAISLVAIPVSHPSAEADTRDVCLPAGSCTYSTIQGAITAAANDDTITVAGIGDTILQPTGDDQAWDVEFTASGATLQGFTLDFNGAADDRVGWGLSRPPWSRGLRSERFDRDRDPLTG